MDTSANSGFNNRQGELLQVDLLTCEMEPSLGDWYSGQRPRTHTHTHACSSRQHRDGGTLGEREGETTRELASCTEEEEGTLVGGVVPIQACERGSERTEDRLPEQLMVGRGKHDWKIEEQRDSTVTTATSIYSLSGWQPLTFVL